MKLLKKITSKITVLLLLTITIINYAQSLYTEEMDGPKMVQDIRFKGVQADIVYLYFSFGYSGSVDIDMYRFTTGHRSTLGLRVGAERFWMTGPGGPTDGSPYFDYNILARSSLTRGLFRFDMYGGLSYQTSDNPNSYPSKLLPMFGIEFKIMDPYNIIGIIGKASGTKEAGVVGLGLVLIIGD